MLFSKAALAAAAVTFMVFVDAKDVTCKKGKMTAEVTLNEGDTFSFRSIRGAVYAGRQRCRVNYKLGSCTAASVSCSKFDLKADKICRTGDSITINSRGSEPRKFCRSKGPKDVSFKKPFSVFFKSNKWKGGAFKCEVSCTAGPPPIKVESVELHWAESVQDMDLYVKAYNETVAYVTCDCSTGNDITRPPGGETITWTGSDYIYLIIATAFSHDVFPNNSGAEIRVYGTDGSETIFSPPMDAAEAGNYGWVLGCFDGDLGLNSLNTLNIFSNDPWNVDCTPLGLDTITPPSATDNWVIDQLAADKAPKGPEKEE